MSRWLVLCALAVLACSILSCTKEREPARQALLHRMELIRTNEGESSRGAFVVYVSPTDAVQAMKVQTPAGKMLKLTGAETLGEFQLSLPLQQYNRHFGQGDYLLFITPKAGGAVGAARPGNDIRRKLRISGSFPEYARIVRPAAGATGISLSPTISWKSSSAIKGIDVSLRNVKTGALLLEKNMGNRGNQVTLSGRTLVRNTAYEIMLEVRAKNGIHFSVTTQTFTTGSE